MKVLRESIVLILVAAFPAALAVAFHPELSDRARAGLEPDAIRIAEVLTWGDAVLWVDARDPESFAAGHIDGAVGFDEGAFGEALGALLAAWTPERRIVVYCDSTACSRAQEVVQRLREAGLSDVYFLHGGWEAWLAARKSR